VYLCAGILLLLFFAAEQAYILKQWHEASETQELRSAITVQVLQLRRLATDIDNGFRGYALMRQSMFLVPVVAAEAEIPRALDRLTELTEKTPSLQGGVQVLKRRLEELIETKRQLTFKIGAGEQEEVLRYIRGGDGVAMAKTIANVFDDLDAKIEREFRETDVPARAVEAGDLAARRRASRGRVGRAAPGQAVLLGVCHALSGGDVSRGRGAVVGPARSGCARISLAGGSGAPNKLGRSMAKAGVETDDPAQ